MNTSIKDIVIGAFAVIGFYVVVTGFNSPQTESQVISATPESHQWEFHLVNRNNQYGGAYAYALNKVTGEVRKYESNWTHNDSFSFGDYVVSKEYVKEVKERKK